MLPGAQQCSQRPVRSLHGQPVEPKHWRNPALATTFFVRLLGTSIGQRVIGQRLRLAMQNNPNAPLVDHQDASRPATPAAGAAQVGLVGFTDLTGRVVERALSQQLWDNMVRRDPRSKLPR